MKKGIATQKTELDKELIKLAIREAIDELALSYAHGAGILIEKTIKSLDDITDSFDQYYTNILGRNNPEVASAYLQLRMKATRASLQLTQSKAAQLQQMQVKFERQVASARARKVRS